MEYTELDDYSLPGGRLTTWEPQTAPQAWRDDPRRLSYIHAEHVRRAQSAGSEWYSQWIGTAFWIPGRLDRDAMERTILAWYGRHEAFRTTVQEEATHPEDDVTRITVAPEAVTVAGRVVDTALSAERARAYTAEYFNTTISPLRWPHCVLVTIEPDDGTDAFAVVFAADHTVMDAYTQVFAIRELSALYESEVSGEPHDLVDYGSYADFSDAERELGNQIDAGNIAVAKWRDFFDSTRTGTQPAPMPGFPDFTPLGDAPRMITSTRASAPGYQTTLSQWLLDAGQTARFNGICKAAGGSMTTGIYTALSMATAKLTGSGELRFISPIHTRTSREWMEAVGWFVGIIPVTLRPAGARTFTDALAPIGLSYGQYKDVGAAPYAPIAELIGGDATPPGFVVSYIDLRTAQGAQEWEPRGARVLRSATLDADEVYLWINRIPGGTNISARYPAERAEAVEVFISAFLEVLHRVVVDGNARYEMEIPALSIEAW